MKTLVTYYSRSGNTKKIAEQIAQILGADLDEISDLKDRSRTIIGWLIAGKDGATKSTTQIEHKVNPDDYDLVIIGTPIWSWTLTPAIRTYLQGKKIKNIAFFCTNGGNRGQAFKEMEQLSQKPVAILDLLDKEIKKDQADDLVEHFCNKISKFING